MQFATFQTLALGTFITLVAGNLDSTACSGVGACIGTSNCNYYNGYDCGTAGTINDQVTAGAQVDMTSGLDKATVATKAEFPTTCDISSQYPGASSVLVKYNFDTDATLYGWIDYTCGQATSITDACYLNNSNPSIVYFCRVIKAGVTCKPQGDILVPSAC